MRINSCSPSYASSPSKRSAAVSRLIKGVARDVFSALAVKHDEVRKVIVEFVARNMRQVKATTTWKEQQAHVARREIADAGVVMMEIFEAIGTV